MRQCAAEAARGQHCARVQRHLLGALICLGRHTLTGHLATLGRQFTDWSADYRLYSQQRLDDAALFGPIRKALTQLLPPVGPVVTALDDTRLKKTSRRTPGVRYLRDPLGPPFWVNLMLGQRCIQQSMAVSDGCGAARLVPVDFHLAAPPLKPRRKAAVQEWEAYRRARREQALGRVGQQRLRVLREALDEQPATYRRQLVCVVDGGYTNRTFLGGLPQGTAVIGRIRADAKLYHLPVQQPQCGRRRVYGEPAPTPEQLRRDDRVPWQQLAVYFGGARRQVRCKELAPLRWRATGAEHDLRLIVLAPTAYQRTRGGRSLYRRPAYLICTDPKLPLASAVQYYLWRWEIEVNFRDEKTLFGLGQAEVHHPRSVQSVPALTVAAYATLLTAAIRLYGLQDEALQLPLPKWRGRRPARASVQRLLAELRHDLWGQSVNLSDFVIPFAKQTKCEKPVPSLASALFYGAARA